MRRWWFLLLVMVWAGACHAPLQAYVPNDPLLSRQWEVGATGLPEAWDFTHGIPSVVIAVLDCGVVPTNREITPQLVPGWDVVAGSPVTSNTYGSEHGTKCAGAAAALGDNGFGGAGVAWGCRVMPVQITHQSTSASWGNAAAGIRWAADHGARVISLSYAFYGDAGCQSAARYARGKGCLVFMAAGNASGQVNTPDSPDIIVVGAVDQSGRNGATYGPMLDFVGPVPLTGYGWWDGVYPGTFSGTSAACPWVAGVAALVWSANPALTPDQVEQILRDTADHLGAPGRNTVYGWGRPNAARAVAAAGGGAPPIHVHAWVLQGSTEAATPPVYDIWRCACGAWRVTQP